jgi:hypothetical protein
MQVCKSTTRQQLGLDGLDGRLELRKQELNLMKGALAYITAGLPLKMCNVLATSTSVWDWEAKSLC